MTVSHSEINAFPWFSSVTAETIQVISQRAYQRHLPTGHALVIEGLPAESGYFLISGDVRVHRMNREGRVQVLARLRPREPVNVISLLTKERINRASVETLCPVTLLVIQAEDFDHIINHYPDFSMTLLKIFADRMVKMTELAAGLSLYTVRARLSRFLIELADQPQSACGWTQDEIAAHIGTVRDVVGRLLREFEDNGLVQRDRQRIFLLDRKRLYIEAEKQN